MTLSFNLFLYVEELNCCCWEVWTLGEATACHCWKDALTQCSLSDCELRFLEQWRCTVLTSASFVFVMFSLLQVFTTNTCSMLVYKANTEHFPAWCKNLKHNHTKPTVIHIYCKQEFQVGQKSQNICTKATESENLNHKYDVHCPFFFWNTTKPFIC